MLINKLLRYFKGNVRFKAYNGFGERLINLCATNNISLWEFKKTDEGFVATVTTKDFKQLCVLSKKSNVEISVLSRKGFWFKAGKYRARWGLIFGIIAFFVFLISMQNIVWRIEISGNEKVKTETIAAELREIGVSKFAYLPGLDLRQKKQQAMLRLPQLSWITINRKGSTLTVDVTERKMKPEIEENLPCNIIASKTGLILYMEVYDGTKVALEKHTVQKGDIIVSGIVNLEQDKEKVQKGKPILVHADAKVIAQTQFQKSLSIDVKQLSKAYTGKIKKKHYLTVFTLKIPLFVATKEKGLYDMISEENPFYFFDIKTPFGFYTANYKYYDKKADNLSMEDARKIVYGAFEKYQATELKDVVVTSKTPHETLKDGILTIKMDYVVEENIAEKSPIDKNSLDQVNKKGT